MQGSISDETRLLSQVTDRCWVPWVTQVGVRGHLLKGDPQFCPTATSSLKAPATTTQSLFPAGDRLMDASQGRAEQADMLMSKKVTIASLEILVSCP